MKKRVIVAILTIFALNMNSVYAKSFWSPKETRQTPLIQYQYTLDDYLKDMEKTIKSNWIPPETNFKNKVIVNFQILRDGTIKNSKITHTSGDTEFDRGALLALSSTGKLPPLPKNVLGGSVDIDFTFERFSYLIKKDRYDK